MKLWERQHVRHSKYGWGTVLESDRHYTVVFFPTAGVKKFVTSQAEFKMVENHVNQKKSEP